ncbi:MAG: hypothetical protein EU539_08435 [Promethearchaeota archaeon]|nr:MAG: hypothetical protein EU539_08435 [Candidatus Lokiarchaeota archaeon]
MKDFFILYTETPWDNLNVEKLTQIRVLSLKSILKTYPVIEPSFFDDLNSKIIEYNHYMWVKSIKRIVGPKNEDYEISNWNFLWAFDNQRRIFQFLFQKVKEQGILVGLAPPELSKLFSDHGKDAILRTLSLLTNPSKMKFLLVLGAKGKSIAEEQQLFHADKNYGEKLNYLRALKDVPNIQGEWYPSFDPRCPICGSFMKEIRGYRVGFGKLICPKCGYEKKKETH